MPRNRKKRVIIIGNSAAGLSALEAFRKRDKDSEVLMIDKEPVVAYSRVITPYFIMGGVKKEEGLFLRTKDYYRTIGAKTAFGQEVQSIDTQAREIVLDGEKKEPFDLLLIATGGSPISPKIEGADPEDVLVLRSLSDAKKLKEMKSKVQKSLFLGAGLVSLQTLQALFTMKGRCTLVVKSDRILSQTLDQEGAEIVERHLAKMGVQIIKGREVVRLKGMNGSRVAILDNGEELETDFVFAGKGVKPNVGFLRSGRIKIQNGIVANESLGTNVEGIYAAGDVAQAPDFFSDKKVNYGLWPSAVEQGEIAGKNMSGLHEKYPGNLKMNVTRIFAMPVASIGDFGSKRVAEALVQKDEKRSIYRKICLDEKGTIIGAVLINRMDDLGVLHGLIQERKDGQALKSSPIWRSPIRYGFVYKNILEGRL
ncbi:MAG TPA: FAD-dependent oxidoreductase [Thermodesulfobacteriota bacterium]|nr:FAD-dependent oxidoreductase [Thermodesulfobacteriota bacterium]